MMLARSRTTALPGSTPLRRLWGRESQRRHTIPFHMPSALFLKVELSLAECNSLQTLQCLEGKKQQWQTASPNSKTAWTT
jgi:hypothetical protein